MTQGVDHFQPPPAAPSAAAAEARLRADFAARPRGQRLLVAFSAGVDSTYLLAVAQQERGEDVLAVTADSPSLARSSLAEAQAFCAERGIDHRLVRTDEFEHEAYVANQGLRCYECKAALFRAMHGMVRAISLDGDQAYDLLLGAVVDDFADVRPGLRAAAEAGARWPLVDAGFTKQWVREASRGLGLSSWNRPAEPCLSSRFPYGEPVTNEGLRMIEAAEAALRFAGFSDCRARHHRIGDGRGFLCRIEVPAAELPEVLAQREALQAALHRIGYTFISVDLAGLKSGGFNQLLRAEAP
ncbi:MAG: ATP-dependent sacrificial sulfur transferase LarE [Planctomycetota bacterium]|nr:MAG: ATP-dependent sacrificial sulfur transferase LarE [Planctomycetota bacterium]